MAKRKMMLIYLIKNSIAAFFAAIEIHNKPNISYRYETVTLLMMNAWETALKAYVKKYIKTRSIFEKDGHTITVDKALSYVNEHINAIKENSFTAIKKNIEEIEKYRNGIAHFYCEQLEPCIFMLTARSALNYVDFMKTQFSKDFMVDEGLFIMPIGFKLPFKPEDFLSKKAAKDAASEEAKNFIQDIVSVIKNLKEQGIEDSIVLGFDIYLESVKKASNSDLLAAITSLDVADATFAKITNAKFSNDPNAQIYYMDDQDFRTKWKYTHSELLKLCKEQIPNFKQGTIFNNIKKQLKDDNNCVFTRRLDCKNAKSASQDFYTEIALEKIKDEFALLNKCET